VIVYVLIERCHGSDLHTYRGIEPSGSGFIMGHEFTGVVVETGDAVKKFQKGDKVISAFTTSWYVTSETGFLVGFSLRSTC
jgi:threonine dehydrogenase-like Zn-dependent dehydrogenase